MALRAGTLLGGRVAYAQLEAGYRTGIEPVLMAAAVPARAGEVVLEAGCGAGAALLCLMHRVPGARGVGVEIDPGLAGLARENLVANGAAGEVVVGDVLLAGLPRVQHAMANPPWHRADGTPSPDAGRRLALQGDGLAWIGALAGCLLPRGSLTLALPAEQTAAAMAALREAGLRRIGLLPLWPREGRAARIVLVQGRRGRDSCRVGAGLVLHGAAGGFTAEADAVLRDGAALPW